MFSCDSPVPALGGDLGLWCLAPICCGESLSTHHMVCPVCYLLTPLNLKLILLKFLDKRDYPAIKLSMVV